MIRKNSKATIGIEKLQVHQIDLEDCICDRLYIFLAEFVKSCLYILLF